MGFFDKIKAAANAVTGGAATVSISVNGTPTRGETLWVTVEAQAEADCKVDKVYLNIRCREEADVIDRDREADGTTSREKIRARETVYEHVHEISDAVEIKAGTGMAWQRGITLPDDALPSVNGKMVRVVWEMEAGLDMFGNDPDSGWVPFDLS
jgi:hypothetical protein